MELTEDLLAIDRIISDDPCSLAFLADGRAMTAAGPAPVNIRTATLTQVLQAVLPKRRPIKTGRCLKHMLRQRPVRLIDNIDRNPLAIVLCDGLHNGADFLGDSALPANHLAHILRGQPGAPAASRPRSASGLR